jgi:two-component system CheB/CheR fusion protein
LQDRVIQAFHFGLRPAGYLFLGQSESLQRATKLFSVIDEKHRIFKRIDVPERHGLSLPFSQPASHETRISSVAKFPSHGRDRIDNGIRRVMERHSPAFAVVNRQNDILRFSGGSIGRYLEPSAGVAHLNLLGMLLSRLRPAVHKALDDARAMHVSVTSDRVAIPVEGETHAVRIIVEPLPEGGAADELCLVAFQDEGPVVSPRAPNDDVDPYFRAMEAELDATKAQLWEITQNADRAEEDLRSVNEEYQSINEELQSSIEELETAKEEMQSINEELQTVNAELIGKNDALLRSNSDLQNLNDSTHIATIFLDSSLRIKSFTAGATNLFFMRASDRGRPITEIAARVPYPALPSDVEQVLRTTSIIERELGLLAEGQSVYIMRIRPYLTVEKVMDGVVITFVDITERKRHEESKARLAAIIESSQDAIIGHGLDGKVVSWNAAAERIFGYTADEAIGRPISIILPQDESKELPDIVSKLIAGEAIEHFETDRTRKDGSRIDVSITISPVLGATGDVIGAATIAREITDRKVAEAHKNLLIAELDHRVKNTLMTVSSMIRQTLRSSDSPRAFADVMLGRIQALGRVHQLLTQDSWDRASLREMVEGELAPYRSAGQNITISGNADVMLTAKATQSLAMALHELATNAVKYGSLSISGGEVAVSWRVTEDEAAQRLVIEWVESGGPTVKEPTRRGFGSDLIERTVTHDLKATVRRDFVPTGLQCRMEVPLTDGTGSAGPEEKADAG